MLFGSRFVPLTYHIDYMYVPITCLDSQMETRDLGKEELLKHGAEFDSKL